MFITVVNVVNNFSSKIVFKGIPLLVLILDIIYLLELEGLM